MCVFFEREREITKKAQKKFLLAEAKGPLYRGPLYLNLTVLVLNSVVYTRFTNISLSEGVKLYLRTTSKT